MVSNFKICKGISENTVRCIKIYQEEILNFGTLEEIEVFWYRYKAKHKCTDFQWGAGEEVPSIFSISVWDLANK